MVEGSSRSDPPRQGTMDGDEQGPQDPVTQTIVTNPQLDPPILDGESHSPQTRNKTSRIKRFVKKVKNYLKSKSVSEL